jgi:hypothetical protein
MIPWWCLQICFSHLLQFQWPHCVLVWPSISCSKLAEFLYLDFYILIYFQLPFVLHYYPMGLLRLSMNKFCLVFNYYVWPVGWNLSVYSPWFHSTALSPCSHTALGMCQYQFSTVQMPNVLHFEWCRCAQTLSSLMIYSFFTNMGHPYVW